MKSINLTKPKRSRENNRDISKIYRGHQREYYIAGIKSLSRRKSSQEDLIEDVIDHLFPNAAQTPFSSSEEANIVTTLDEMGAFMIKGTVQLLAQRLDCSIPSIYRYRQQNQASKQP